MRTNRIFAALLLLVAGLQTAWAQKVLLYKTNSQVVEYEVSELDSIVFVEAEAKLVQQIVLSVTSLSLQPNDMRFLTATVLPENAQNKVVAWQSSDTNVAEVNQSGRVIANAKGTCTITCAATDGSGVTAECRVTVAVDNSGTINGREYVDLGLPSGALWATCNVGASKPEEYGDYFAWGETTTKSIYDWSTYKWCKGSSKTMTKYCTQSGYGYYSFTDNLTELQPEDDAATANWGSGWQMPSLDQIKELYDSSNTTTEWTQVNGVNGRKITSKSNGNSIFLPAAGYRDDTSLKYAGSNGYYWSRSLSASNSGIAYGLYFSSDYIYWGNSSRNCGLSVRPVRFSSVQLVTSITLNQTSLSLEPGKTQTLTATVLPSNATNKTVVWTSSNTSVATVSTSGMVTANANGTCTITCSATDGSGVKATCQVTVGAAGQTYTVNGVSFNMIPVAGGTFWMGSADDDSDAYDREKPRHQVTLSSFSIGETEVTQALWYAVMGAKPTSSISWSTTYGLGDNYPAYYVSWNDCQTFITKLNQLTGKTFRLPTEAEWEYAARGGNQSKGYTYSGSNTIGDVAWYILNSSKSTHPVATKARNELGIYDMSGNVWEWCQDWYGAYSSGSQTNPTGPSSGSYRVFRGGSWSIDGATGCRVAGRYYNSPTSTYYDLGFRLAL